MSPEPDHPALAQTQRWLERAVIGLNLCPFAKGVHAKGQIHYVLSHADDTDALLQTLKEELLALVACDPQVRDTTLLVAPHVLADFWDFNAFLARADKLLRTLRLDGHLQIASFHPDYEFADSTPDALSNYSNRAPYPTLHLLREDSIAQAVAAFGDTERIYENNKNTLQNLGLAGWKALDVGPAMADTAHPSDAVRPAPLTAPKTTP